MTEEQTAVRAAARKWLAKIVRANRRRHGGIPEAVERAAQGLRSSGGGTDFDWEVVDCMRTLAAMRFRFERPRHATADPEVLEAIAAWRRVRPHGRAWRLVRSLMSACRRTPNAVEEIASQVRDNGNGPRIDDRAVIRRLVESHGVACILGHVEDAANALMKENAANSEWRYWAEVAERMHHAKRVIDL